MASSDKDTPSTFPLFPTLPPELRNQIWHDALPDGSRPGLFLYDQRLRCWQPRQLSPGEDGYSQENPEHNLVLEFQHSRLADAQFEVAMAYANVEARGIVLTWARERGLRVVETQIYAGYPNYLLFARSFDSDRDILCLPEERLVPHVGFFWNRFIAEPTNRAFEPDLLNRNVDVRSVLSRIAMPETMVETQASNLEDMFQYYPGIRTIYVIVGKAPGEEDILVGVRDQKCVETGHTEKLVATRDAGTWQFDFDFEYSTEFEISDLVTDMTLGLEEGISDNSIEHFEIRYITARVYERFLSA